MESDIIGRLNSLGYIVTSEDDFLIEFILKKVIEEIENQCNIKGIPDGLYKVAVDMVCGEFLQIKKNSGQLAESSIDTGTAIKQIKEGDTTIVYSAPEGAGALSPVEQLIHYLLNHGRSQLIAYRRIRW